MDQPKFYTMKKNSLLALFLVLTFLGYSQSAVKANFLMPKSEKGKPVKYNAFGMGVYPIEHLMAGGNHISYRKIGFGLSWRFGIENFLYNKKGYSGIDYDTASNNGWLTGKTKNYYSFGANFNVVFPITKKIPIYFGIGAVRQRQFAEMQTPVAVPGETEWQQNRNETKFKLNFGVGTFIPLGGNVVLNLSYDHLPQTFFVGIAISGPFNYEDLDMW